MAEGISDRPDTCCLWSNALASANFSFLLHEGLPMWAWLLERCEVFAHASLSRGDEGRQIPGEWILTGDSAPPAS